VPRGLLDHPHFVPIEVIVAIEELEQMFFVRFAYLPSNTIKAPGRDDGITEHRECGKICSTKIRDPSPALSNFKRGQGEIDLRSGSGVLSKNACELFYDARRVVVGKHANFAGAPSDCNSTFTLTASNWRRADIGP
jgi:hypothetical protein